MKPAPFDYQAPASLEAALALKARHGDDAKFLAGGQSLIPAMNFRLVQASLLVDVNGLTGPDYVQADGGDPALAADDFFRGLFTTDLAPDEMVTEVALPAPPPRTGTAFVAAYHAKQSFGVSLAKADQPFGL